MKIKRFVAKDIRQAMRMVKEELGADAVIMSNKSVDEGVEIVAARDFDEETVQKHLRTQPKETSPKIKKKIELANFDTEKDQLHVVTSSRKIGEDGVIPKRSNRRNIDQYVGYAEKADLVSKNKAVVTKPKPAIKKIAAPAAKQFSFEAMKQEKPEPAVSESFMQEMRDEIKSLKAVFNTKII